MRLPATLSKVASMSHRAMAKIGDLTRETQLLRNIAHQKREVARLLQFQSSGDVRRGT